MEYGQAAFNVCPAVTLLCIPDLLSRRTAVTICSILVPEILYRFSMLPSAYERKERHHLHHSAQGAEIFELSED